MGFLFTLAVLASILFLLTIASEESTESPPEVITNEFGDRERLMKFLLADYNAGLYPTKPDVEFGVSLINIDIDEARSTLESNVWLRYTWRDSRLRWDTTEYPVPVLRVAYNALWHPDITLYNSADLSKTSSACWESNILVYPQGKVLWVPPCHFSSFCKLTVHVEPNKEQHCLLKFGSWTFDANIMDLNLYNNETGVDLADFWSLNDWNVVSTKATKNIKFYDCCAEPYADLTYNITLKRKTVTEAFCSP